jgi:hypothetical protein
MDRTAVAKHAELEKLNGMGTKLSCAVIAFFMNNIIWKSSEIWKCWGSVVNVITRKRYKIKI